MAGRVMTGRARPKRQPLAEGRAWRRTVAQVVVRDHGLCHLCGHYGAKSADHIIPDTEGGKPVAGNLKAVHAVGSPCADCTIAAGRPVYCNEIRGGYSIARARRILRERTGLRMPEDREATGPEGREWLAYRGYR